MCVSKKEYNMEIEDHILDNIYGQIGLTKLEKEIERLPIFKRLHEISQLGLTNYIFPCALHNRYTHSIGVMHMAGEMAFHINVNMKKPFFSDIEIQIIRLAGMLHDIGHYPMSHNIELSYKEMSKRGELKKGNLHELLKLYTNIPNILKNIVDDNVMNKNVVCNKMDYSGSTGLHHERIGALIIRNDQSIHDVVKKNFILDDKGCIYKEFCDDINNDPDNITNQLLFVVGEMIRGNYECELDKKYKWAKKYSAMTQIIHSSLDADNIDYLLRDATFSGTTYGLMDISVLLNSLYVSQISYKENEKYIVGITKKGIGPVDQFIINKFFAYKQMIYSKYVSIFEAMLFYLVCNQNFIDEEEYKPKEFEKMVQERGLKDKYLNFTDSYIKEKICNLKNIVKDNEELIKKIVCKLNDRKAFDINGDEEFIYVSNDDDKIKNFFEKNESVMNLKCLSKKIESKKGEELSEDEKIKLFSYRFEEYRLVKQQKIEDFIACNNSLKDMGKDNIVQSIFYRFLDGMPILEKDKEYEINEKDINDYRKWPKLIVDSEESIVSNICNMKYISLRRYNID